MRNPFRRRGVLILSILSFVLLGSQVQAEIKIAQKHRLENPEGGYCTWAALETVSNHLGIKGLEGIVEYYTQFKSSGAGEKKVKAQLVSLSVKYEMRKYGQELDVAFLQKEIRKGNPLVIGLERYPHIDEGKKVESDGTQVVDVSKAKDRVGSHAVVLIYITDKKVRWIDSNDIGKDYEASMEWFLQHWGGWAVAINTLRNSHRH